MQTPRGFMQSAAHPHHGQSGLVCSGARSAPFDRWRKRGLEGQSGLLQGHAAGEWGRRLHSGLLTPSPVLFRGDTQDLESGALGGSVTRWLRGPVQAAQASVPQCKMRRSRRARPGPLGLDLRPSRGDRRAPGISYNFPSWARVRTGGSARGSRGRIKKANVPD